MKLFDKSNNNKPFCAIYNLPREIDTVDFSHDDQKFVISGADGLVRVFKIDELNWDFMKWIELKFKNDNIINFIIYFIIYVFIYLWLNEFSYSH